MEHDSDWATAVHVDMHSARQKSVHRTQLATVDCVIRDLSVTKPDGRVFSITNTNADSFLKFVISGGTDDPAFELHLRLMAQDLHGVSHSQFPPPDTIVYKFPAFQHTTHSSQYMEYSRVPVPFCPNVQVDFSNIERAPRGPSDFSDALHGLTWDHDKERNVVKLCWRSVRGINYCLRRADHGSNLDNAVLQAFLGAGEDVSFFDESTSFSVEVGYNASLEYKYRYLLACPQSHAFWRYCHVRQTFKATVPLDLCGTFGLKSEETYTMEAAHPKDWVKRHLPPLARIDDSKGQMVFIPPKYAFSGTLEAEFYLKGAALFEKDAVDEKKNLFLNGTWNFEAIDASATIPGIPPRRWVFFVDIPVPYNLRDGMALPDERDPVTIIWSKDGLDRKIRWSGKVITSPSIVTDYNTAILVEQPITSKADLTKEGWRPFFHFGLDIDHIRSQFRFFDRLMFGEPSLNIPTANWLRNILLGRHNWAGQACVPVNIDVSIMAQISASLNVSQRKSYFAALETIFSQTISPPGSGKSVLLAALILTLIIAGEKVIVVVQSNEAVREVLDKTLQLARKFHAPEHIIRSIVWNVADSGDGCDPGWHLLQSLRQAHLPTNPDPSMEEFLKSAVHASIMGRENHPHAIKNILRTVLNDYEHHNWAPSNDDEERAVLAHLQDMLSTLESFDQSPSLAPAAPIGVVSLSQPTILPVDMEDLKRAVVHAWEAAVLFYLSHKCSALFTTFGNIPSKFIRHFGGTSLLADEICNTTTMNLITACSRVLPTLKRVHIVGDPDQLPPHSEPGDRSHMREQLKLDPMSALAHTGIDCVRLDTQYRMHPDISEVVIEGVYTEYDPVTKTEKQLLFNDVSTLSQPGVSKARQFVAEYLGKKADDTKLSVFISVEDGRCLRSKLGTSKTNHQQVVAVLDIVRLMQAVGFTEDEIIIICFYTESANSVKSFLWSQGVRVRAMDTFVTTVDASQGKEKLATIVVTGTSGCDEEPLGFLGDIHRLNVALTRAKVLRVFVGHQRITLGVAWMKQYGAPPSAILLRKFSQRHIADGQMKVVTIGKRLLDFEDNLRPDRYYLASDGSEAQDMYDNLRIGSEDV